MGIAAGPASIVASALPRHAPHPDWAALARDGLGDVLAHHVTLAAPQRLLVLGAEHPAAARARSGARTLPKFTRI